MILLTVVLRRPRSHRLHHHLALLLSTPHTLIHIHTLTLHTITRTTDTRPHTGPTTEVEATPTIHMTGRRDTRAGQQYNHLPLKCDLSQN